MVGTDDLQLIAALRSLIDLTPEPLGHYDVGAARELVQASGLPVHVVAMALRVNPNTVHGWLSRTNPRTPSDQLVTRWARFLAILARRSCVPIPGVAV